MKYLKKSFWAAAVIWVILPACQDDEEVSRQSLLIGAWSLDDQSIKKVTVSSGDNELELTEEEFIQYLAIQGENINTGELRLFSENTTFTFAEDGSLLIEGIDNSEYDSGNWELSENQNQLLLRTSREVRTFDIRSLSSKRLEAESTFTQADNGTLYQIDFVFLLTK
uniref:Lipocalin-like domain-containing protein n=1 Tax=Roseihalotalea indica TaxID=2867963 RepID=A0AA49PYV5_9BACT|nr:hypothetical protein K4G66_14425 [Tunicatimonas sp. TK19036]